MEIKVIKPIGYCSGVINAIKLANKVRCDYPNKHIYIFGMLVHNDSVINSLKENGIETINIIKDKELEQLANFNSNDIVIFSAHGHPTSWDKVLISNNVTFYDSTCPKVKHNLDLISSTEKEVIYIGKKDHPEVVASLSLRNKDKVIALYDITTGLDATKRNVSNPLVVNQTTLSILELQEIHKDIKKKFPNATFTDEICNATRLRQEEVQHIDKTTDLILIVGGANSSNTNKLYTLAKVYNPNKKVLMISNLEELKKQNINFKEIKKVAIASGTSTPLDDIIKIEEYLKKC